MKSWYQSLSLHSKQILIIIIINAVSLFVASTLFFYNNVTSYQKNQLSQLEGKSEVIAGTIKSALLFHDSHAAQEQLSALVSDTGILYAGVFDDQKSFFAKYGILLHHLGAHLHVLEKLS